MARSRKAGMLDDIRKAVNEYFDPPPPPKPKPRPVSETAPVQPGLGKPLSPKEREEERQRRIKAAGG